MWSGFVRPLLSCRELHGGILLGEAPMCRWDLVLQPNLGENVVDVGDRTPSPLMSSMQSTLLLQLYPDPGHRGRASLMFKQSTNLSNALGAPVYG
jgi:hypothetical protein